MGRGTCGDQLINNVLKLLTDEMIKYQEFDLAEEYTAKGGTSQIKLEWDDFKTVRGLMIYNSYDYAETFVDVSKVEFEYKRADGSTATAVIEDLPFDWDWNAELDFEFMRPGGSAIAEFNEMPVKSITITVSSAADAEHLALGEIIVLGKDAPCDGVDEFKAYSYTNAEYGPSHIVVDSQNFGTVPGTDLSTNYGYDVLHDDGTDDAYILQKGVADQFAYFKDVYSTSFYAEAGETPPRYDLSSLMTASEAERSEYRDEYAARNSLIFLAGNMIREENIQSALDALQAYGVTKEQYTAFGFADYSKVKEIAVSSLVEFRAKYEYRLANIKEGETPASIAQELTKDISQGFLASLPSEVSDALEEIGASDMYGVLVGSIFFKMAGLLLPIIYLIMTSNSLIAGQVDSGSMAYVLSSSVKRKTVTFTQAIFLIGSLFLMFCCTSITSMVCFALVDVTTDLTYAKLLLINLGAFLVMFAMSGICFLASCWFNRSKNSMALGGGLNMFFLVATMLGLFGSPVLPSIVRMKALNNFNYVSIISLFDVVSILEGTTAFLWKLGILAAVGIVCYIVGSRKFARKDLPL